MSPLVTQGITAPLRLADFKLAAFDMDSTLISIECIDEIAALSGKGQEVAAITEAAMRGEIADYKESLRQRVALLKGVTEAHMLQVYEERLQLNPGAAELVAACKAAGLKVLLVSGELVYVFANPATQTSRPVPPAPSRMSPQPPRASSPPRSPR